MITLSNGLQTLKDGAIEFGPSGLMATRRGIRKNIPTHHMHMIHDQSVVGLNATGNQSIFGRSFVLDGSRLYRYEMVVLMTKSTGATSSQFQTGFGGTAVINKMTRCGDGVLLSSAADINTSNNVTPFMIFATESNLMINTGYDTPTTLAIQKFMWREQGLIEITTGGTLIPQYSLSVAPGGNFTTQPGSYFSIFPLAESGTRTQGVII
jgi:hypothetical protein